MSAYGTHEAEKRFNWVVPHYPKMQGLMNPHVLIQDLYGPSTTCFIRKQLAYQSPKAPGKGWVAIGDAVGFTNPLFSPEINANIGTSAFAAEHTQHCLADPGSRAEVLGKYDADCENRIPGLHRMDIFNHVCMRSPALGPLDPWAHYGSTCLALETRTGNPNWSYKFSNVSEMSMGWDWGAHDAEYVAFVTQAIALLVGPPTEPAPEVVQEMMRLSGKAVTRAPASGRYKSWWAGLLRWYDDDLRFCGK